MLEVIILAIVQGISEFLPISSSAHLVVFRELFHIGSTVITENSGLIFDIALHFGTALAIIVFFFKDFLKIFTEGIQVKKTNNKMLWYIVVATIPGAIFGFLLEDIIDTAVRGNYYLIAISLIAIGMLLFVVDLKYKQKKSIEKIGFKEVLIIGFAQVFALIPGFSRSGTTLIAARMLEIKREDAAKFSFYLSVPMVLGALLLGLIKTDLSLITSNLSVFAVGIVVSFLVGIICIKYLLKYLKSHDFKIFMIYRIIFGIIILLMIL